jgi:hypothetical protein
MTGESRVLPRQHVLHFFLALATVLLIEHDSLGRVGHGLLIGMDSYMRLVRIQDALDHGNWFGYVVSRDDSGLGVVIPWSHVLDAVILLLRAPLRLLLPPDEALLWAGAMIGPLSVGLLGTLCAWSVAPLAQRGWLWIAPFAAASASPIVDYGLFGGVTHHVLLVALAVGAWGAGGRGAFGNARGGALAGLFAGIGIWVSPEAMVFGMMAFAAMFLSWATRPEPRVGTALAAAGAVFLATIGFALLLDPPYAGWAVPQLDRLSVTFLCLALIVCALCWVPRGLARFRLSITLRFTVIGFAGAAGAALWLGLFPGFLHGVGGLMTSEEVDAFFGQMTEWLPLDAPWQFVAVSGAALLAAVAAFVLGVRHGDNLSGILWFYAGTCGTSCIVLGFLHSRFASYPAAGAAMMLPVLLSHVDRSVLLRWGSLVRPGLLAAFLVAPMLLGILLKPRAEYAAEKSEREAWCQVTEAAQLLAPYSGAVVLADVNDGSELLYRTRIKTVGSLYHENIAGFMRLRAAWRARDLDEVPPELRATGARYVLICPGALRTAVVDGPKTTLFDRLNRGDPPAWLHPVAREPGSGWVLYQMTAVDTADPKM